jgi:hypothetical protein
MSWYSPTARRPLAATDPSCDTVGECTANRCTRGKIRDVCSVAADCAQPADTCRTIVNWALVPDLTLEWARIRRTDVPGYTPVTPGCSRKVDILLDANRPISPLKLKAHGTADGRLRKERDVFRFRR